MRTSAKPAPNLPGQARRPGDLIALPARRDPVHEPDVSRDHELAAVRGHRERPESVEARHARGSRATGVGRKAPDLARHRLEQQGWIESSWGDSENNRRAKFYALTRTGRKQLADDGTWADYRSVQTTALAAPIVEEATARMPTVGGWEGLLATGGRASSRVRAALVTAIEQRLRLVLEVAEQALPSMPGSFTCPTAAHVTTHSRWWHRN